MFVHDNDNDEVDYSPEKKPLRDAGRRRIRGYRRHGYSPSTALDSHSRSQNVVVDLVELFPAGSSAWIMSAAMSSPEYPTISPPDAQPRPPNLFLFRPSRWALLASCIVFGCSAASFLQRRQLRDPNQVYVFAICVVAGAVVGQYLEAAVDYIMMVNVSWAVCVAMLASAVGHRIKATAEL